MRPIVIVGQPRTGTTILHDLMAQDPANRAPLSWEIERPVPPPRTATYDTDPRIAECQAGFDLVESIIPGFTAFHELGAQLAQEDVRIFTSDFQSMQYPLQFEVPAVQPVAAARGRHGARPTAGTGGSCSTCSRSTRASGGCSSRRRTCGTCRRCWPSTPTRSSIQNHRDPLKVIASVSALGASLREMTTDHFDVRTLADAVRRRHHGRPRPRARRPPTGLFAPGQVVDLRFQDFRTDPIADHRPRIYDALGLELTAEAEARHAGLPGRASRRPGQRPAALLVRRHRPRRGRAARRGCGTTRSTSASSPNRSAPDHRHETVRTASAAGDRLGAHDDSVCRTARSPHVSGAGPRSSAPPSCCLLAVIAGCSAEGGEDAAGTTTTTASRRTPTADDDD